MHGAEKSGKLVKKSIYPEYESVAEISRKTGKPFQEIYRMIQEESNGQV